MELADGVYLLSGVQEGTLPHGDSRNRGDSDSGYLAMILDEKVWVGIEDSEDGYRSSLGVFDNYDDIVVTNRFNPTPVLVKNVNDLVDGEDFCGHEIYSMYNKLLIRLGTNNSDDYYPYFVASWHPENFEEAKLVIRNPIYFLEV